MKGMFNLRPWSFVLTLWLFQLAFSVSVFGQQDATNVEANSGTDSPIPPQSVKHPAPVVVPNIDPRQYVVISEWKSDDKSRSVRGIKGGESKAREVMLAELDAVLAQEEESLKAETDSVKMKVRQANIAELQSKIATIQAANGKLPWDYFHSLCDSCDLGVTGTWSEYYNEVLWRNGGQKTWEPIWWLNAYPWSTMDNRMLQFDEEIKTVCGVQTLPYQKYSSVSDDAVLRIWFDQNELARNENFKGSISLKAFLDNGKKGGRRSIEISPYSVIGKEGKTIKIGNTPALEMADSFVNFFRTSRMLSDFVFWRFRSGSQFEPEILQLPAAESVEDMVDDLQNVFEYAMRSIQLKRGNGVNATNRSETQAELQSVCSDLGSTIYFSDILVDACGELSAQNVNGQQPLTVNELQGHLDNLLDEGDLIIELLSEEITSDSPQGVVVNQAISDTLQILRDRFKSNASLIGDYLKQASLIVDQATAVKSYPVQAKKVFYSISGHNEVSFPKRLTQFEQSVTELAAATAAAKKNFAKQTIDYSVSRDILNTINEKLRESMSDLNHLSHISGARLAGMLNEFYYGANFWKEGYSAAPYAMENQYFDSYRIAISNSDKYITSNPNLLQELKTALAHEAGKVLYEDLVFGTIDLTQAGADPGDRLYVTVVWDDFDQQLNGSGSSGAGTDATEKSTESSAPVTTSSGASLYTAVFDVRKFGWNLEAADNSILIKRLDENLLREDYPLNETNFKLTGGVSMMWTYHNDKRVHQKIKLDKKTRIPKFDKYGNLRFNCGEMWLQRTAKWLEPSIGIHASYLDYQSDRSFEMGIGPSIGLFGNKIFLTTGWNLMELDEQSGYIGLGFSFINFGSDKISAKK